MPKNPSAMIDRAQAWQVLEATAHAYGFTGEDAVARTFTVAAKADLKRLGALPTNWQDKEQVLDAALALLDQNARYLNAYGVDVERDLAEKKYSVEQLLIATHAHGHRGAIPFLHTPTYTTVKDAEILRDINARTTLKDIARIPSVALNITAPEFKKPEINAITTPPPEPEIRNKEVTHHASLRVEGSPVFGANPNALSDNQVEDRSGVGNPNALSDNQGMQFIGPMQLSGHVEKNTQLTMKDFTTRTRITSADIAVTNAFTARQGRGFNLVNASISKTWQNDFAYGDLRLDRRTSLTAGFTTMQPQTPLAQFFSTGENAMRCNCTTGVLPAYAKLHPFEELSQIGLSTSTRTLYKNWGYSLHAGAGLAVNNPLRENQPFISNNLQFQASAVAEFLRDNRDNRLYLGAHFQQESIGEFYRSAGATYVKDWSAMRGNKALSVSAQLYNARQPREVNGIVSAQHFSGMNLGVEYKNFKGWALLGGMNYEINNGTENTSSRILQGQALLGKGFKLWNHELTALTGVTLRSVNDDTPQWLPSIGLRIAPKTWQKQ